MEQAQKLLVVGEVNDGHVSATTTEVLAAGRELAQPTGAKVAVGLLGSDVAAAAQEALHAGADLVYTVEDAQLATLQIDLYLAALQELCRTTTPDIILLGRTALGRDIGPRLACRLGVSLLQDCLKVALDPDTGRLTGTRPVYGGNVLARIRCTTTPQIATLRPKAYTPLAPDPNRQGEITAVPVTLDASMARVTVLRQELDESPGIKLEDARVVVAGGRGMGGAESFRELQELAGILGAGIGASRAAVDAGWVPGNWQIGLTGKTITPELYITVGISGASQHMAGCSGAKVIVAINKDREANIFRAARYGVVGDWQTVLPAFIEAVRDLR
jgi:electron transfer flavoprotein alpha subunit